MKRDLKISSQQDDQRPEQGSGKVIQFPGAAPVESVTVAPDVVRAKPNINKYSLLAIAAIMLATLAANRYAFVPNASLRTAKLESASVGEGTRTRDLASVSDVSNVSNVSVREFKRDAQWEMAMSEKLASVKSRATASAHIGRSVTLEEKLRWGTLDELKYTFVKQADAGHIRYITYQGGESEPDYIPDRPQFLREYGSLLEGEFSSARLKAVEMSQDKTVEQFIIFGKDHQPISEAHFELDKHKRFLSLKMNPVQI